MAKIRSLPDKFYDKDYEHNGIHRVPLWRIAGYALNNTATNVYLMMMNYATYYLMGWVGVGMMVASSLTMMMRMWDGVTDPFIGFMVDKTNGKFGKNRPFIVIGQIILCVTSWVAFHVTHKLPQAARFPFYVVVLMVYYLGYTCQCVVTKSAQSCVTNDPKQRPMFASFDGVYNTLVFAILGIIIPRIANSYNDVGGYASLEDDRHHVCDLHHHRCDLHRSQGSFRVLRHRQTCQGRPEGLLGYPEEQPRHPDAGSVRIYR